MATYPTNEACQAKGPPARYVSYPFGSCRLVYPAGGSSAVGTGASGQPYYYVKISPGDAVSDSLAVSVFYDRMCRRERVGASMPLAALRESFPDFGVCVAVEGGYATSYFGNFGQVPDFGLPVY